MAVSYVILFFEASMVPHGTQLVSSIWLPLIFAIISSPGSSQLTSFTPVILNFVSSPDYNSLSQKLSSAYKDLHSALHLIPSNLKDLSQTFSHLTPIPTHYPNLRLGTL